VWLRGGASEGAGVERNTNTHNTNKRVFWLVGGAGTGKSVVSAQLLLTAGIREHIKAWHFCRHDNAAGSDVRVILQSWAAMLTQLLPNFCIEGGEKEKEEDVVGKALAATSVAEMFELLLAAPLRRMAEEGGASKAKDKGGSSWDQGAEIKKEDEHSRKQQQQPPAPHPPCVIVLDAVDELPRGSLEALLQLVADKFGDLPSFVRLFIAVSIMLYSSMSFLSSRFLFSFLPVSQFSLISLSSSLLLSLHHRIKQGTKW